MFQRRITIESNDAGRIGTTKATGFARIILAYNRYTRVALLNRQLLSNRHKLPVVGGGIETGNNPFPSTPNRLYEPLGNTDMKNLIFDPAITRLGVWRFAVLSSLLLAMGCENKAIEAPVKKNPRPVATRLLSLTRPPTSAMVSASAASWKKEEIGFEVGGRIEWVAEPSMEIEGRVFDEDGNLIVEGTPIARVESERHQLQVETARAEVSRAEQAVAAAEIESNQSLTSQMAAAEAELNLAETELERSKRLLAQNAGAQADVDRDFANSKTAAAKIKQIKANMRSKDSEIVSLKLQIEQAKQKLRDAQRSLEDCTLYSSFRGQIADVSVVPGSFVAAGNPVATVQMMDPIKIEVELSAENSRRLRKRQSIPVFVTQADGSIQQDEGFLYLIDPVADPQTRTFTLTLLLLNKKNAATATNVADNIAVTDQVWRMNFSFLPGAKLGATYVAERVIHEDSLGYFLWRINDFKQSDPFPNDNLFKVSKMRIELGDAKLPFLGNWLFQQIKVLDTTFDPKVHLVAGKLTVKTGEPDDWDGDTILIDRDSQWMVRPGDLVKVDLSSGDAEPGYYVPMDAISRVANRNYIFLVDESSGTSIAKKIEVTIGSKDDAPTSSLLQVHPAEGTPSLEGQKYITRGAHYLRDGEPIRISSMAPNGEDQQ